MLDLLFGDSKIILGDRMEKLIFAVGDIARMKKNHPCGSNEWEITRTGMDIGLKCQGCGHFVMMPRVKFQRMVREIKAN